MGCNCGNKNKTVVSTIPNMNTCSCGKPISECCKTTGKPCGCHHHEQTPCLADHTQTLVDSVYTTTVTATDTWVMPAVDDCVQLHLKDVTNILPGAILWNQSVGSLHVSAYDSSTGYVTACNQGEDGNAEAGSDFPSCMAFHVGIPVECDCADNWTGPCLSADVTSPGVGEITEVAVTTVSGLFIGDIIDIAGFMYRIVAINDVHTIVVKNEGFGAPLGTVLKNDPNCTGKPCTVKITVVNSDDPCTKDPVHEGVLIVCEDGERRPLEGTADNQITYWDNEDKKWKLKTVKLDDGCTNLTVDLTLDPLISVYVVNVVKTGVFKVGDVVYIGDIQFTVNSIINSTQMRLEILDAVSQITVIDGGTSICLGDCCVDKVSGFTSGTNTMNYDVVTTIDGDGYLLREGVTTKDISSDLPSVTLAIPNTNGKPVTILGSITIMCQGTFHTDTHTFNLEKAVTGSTGGGTVAQYNTLCTADGPTVELTAMPKLNNVNIYSNEATSGRQYCLALDEYTSKQPPVGTADSGWNNYTRSVTLPIVCTIANPNTSNTITINATMHGYNLHDGDGESGSSKYNEDIRVRVKKIQTIVALAWIVQ